MWLLHLFCYAQWVLCCAYTNVLMVEFPMYFSFYTLILWMRWERKKCWRPKHSTTYELMSFYAVLVSKVLLSNDSYLIYWWMRWEEESLSEKPTTTTQINFNSTKRNVNATTRWVEIAVCDLFVLDVFSTHDFVEYVCMCVCVFVCSDSTIIPNRNTGWYPENTHFKRNVCFELLKFVWHVSMSHCHTGGDFKCLSQFAHEKWWYQKVHSFRWKKDFLYDIISWSFSAFRPFDSDILRWTIEKKDRGVFPNYCA